MRHDLLWTVLYFTTRERNSRKKGTTARTSYLNAKGALEGQPPVPHGSPSESYWLLPIITYADMANID